MNAYFRYSDSDISAHYCCDETPDPRDFKMHTHDRYELFCFFGGKGVYKIEGTRYALEAGDILIMRPAESHYIEISPDSPYTRLVINFEARLFDSVDREQKLISAYTKRKNGHFNLYRSSDFGNDDYLVYIKKIIAPSQYRGLQIISNLIPLLNEISTAFQSKNEDSINDSPDYRIIRYINRNLSNSITLDDICREFFISKPQLCRMFKAATGSTVWDYITVKRLVTAKNLIQSGRSPTKIYTECGFSDYSSFYRAYRKKYGVSPSDTASAGK